MKILNQKSNPDNLKEQAYKNIDNILSYIHDILYFIEYIPKKEYTNIEDIYSRTKQFRDKCIDEIDTPLIALKNYTEGKCSWERAGMMCDLHIWGLREYCENKNVDCNSLRIDEYYGIEGEEGISKIKSNWKKLDPNKKVHPINYGGKSTYTQYPMLKDISNKEKGLDEATENYIKYKAKMLISEYVCEFYKTLNYFIENNPELEDEIEFYGTQHIYKDLSKFSNGISITTENDLTYLEFLMDICHLYLKDAKKSNDFENVLNSFYKLENALIDEYYCYSINQSKKPNEESAEQFKNMIMSIPKEKERK